jgi:hypothetical protein
VEQVRQAPVYQCRQLLSVLAASGIMSLLILRQVLCECATQIARRYTHRRNQPVLIRFDDIRKLKRCGFAPLLVLCL